MAKSRLITLADEVIALLASDPNATVRITLEIDAEFPNGASDTIKRGVSENATSLDSRRRTGNNHTAVLAHGPSLGGAMRKESDTNPKRQRGGSIHERAGGLRTIGIFREEPARVRGLWGPNCGSLQIIYQICPECGAIRTSNQCD